MFKRAVCLETLLFQVSAKDAFGNAVARASLNFAVVVDGVRASSNNCSISITDNHDGTCTIQLTFIWSGLHTINLLICEQDIQNSPISITVEPDAQEKERYMKSVLEDQVLAQIQQWALGKRIHTMLNELNLAHLERQYDRERFSFDFGCVAIWQHSQNQKKTFRVLQNANFRSD